jgi:hypothetical protein
MSSKDIIVVIVVVIVVVVLGLPQMTKKAFQFYFQIRKIETEQKTIKLLCIYLLYYYSSPYFQSPIRKTRRRHPITAHFCALITVRPMPPPTITNRSRFLIFSATTTHILACLIVVVVHHTTLRVAAAIITATAPEHSA